jgi:hypothetical protein
MIPPPPPFLSRAVKGKEVQDQEVQESAAKFAQQENESCNLQHFANHNIFIARFPRLLGGIHKVWLPWLYFFTPPLIPRLKGLVEGILMS